VDKPRDQDQELLEFLNELRVLVPGTQTLFAFMLAMPFTMHFERMTAIDRQLYGVGFVCAAISSLLLMAPSMYHRLHWRRDVRDLELMLRTSNRLAIGGGVFLALAMGCAVFVATDALFGALIACAITALLVVLFGWFWYGLPLSRRARERRA
jgi:hypothetical protein